MPSEYSSTELFRITSRDVNRFIAKVSMELGNPLACWLWKASKKREGYGEFGFARKKWLAHRFSYLLHMRNLPIGRKKNLDHKCRNRGCVNPSHLEVVSAKENTLRGFGPAALNARKSHCIHGHNFRGKNLRIRPDGSRECVACHRQRSESAHWDNIEASRKRLRESSRRRRGYYVRHPEQESQGTIGRLLESNGRNR